MTEPEYNIGDTIQVFDYEKGKWSRPYKIYKINSPDDKFALGYCAQKSYWMRSLCGAWERTWFNTNDMRHYHDRT